MDGLSRHAEVGLARLLCMYRGKPGNTWVAEAFWSSAGVRGSPMGQSDHSYTKLHMARPCDRESEMSGHNCTNTCYGPPRLQCSMQRRLRFEKTLDCGLGFTRRRGGPGELWRQCGKTVREDSCGGAWTDGVDTRRLNGTDSGESVGAHPVHSLFLFCSFWLSWRATRCLSASCNGAAVGCHGVDCLCRDCGCSAHIRVCYLWLPGVSLLFFSFVLPSRPFDDCSWVL